ncbi:AraC family transcriptional regulator [Fulvivirgaceae bacterium BMA12]|uniref:AraC family transcriptional regulator n=1 Tax=Agaribacillus aureus TaxID=3051825 RepID=A0ABT8LEP9_9BACT|nr:AraC family transcriptional regulator [Fulvivirgaceae bacterium BMA12]
MILKEFPDISWLKKQIASGFQDQKSWDNRPLPDSGWPSVILNVKTREAERVNIKGPLSIFMNVKGWSAVGVNKKNIKINENAYVLTNPGQHYNLLIDEPTATETLNIHFGEKFYEEALYVLKNDDNSLLNNPFGQHLTLELPIKSFFRDHTFNQLINMVLSTESSGSLINDAALFALFQHVFEEYQEDNRKGESLESLKRCTREEIMKRLLIARDYIHVYYPLPISLQELSAVSCLSRFHFLRLFKQAFGISPYQYIKKIRIRQALYLISKNQHTLEDIAAAVGLKNGSSLSRMIHQSQGVYPSGLFTD